MGSRSKQQGGGSGLALPPEVAQQKAMEYDREIREMARADSLAQSAKQDAINTALNVLSLPPAGLKELAEEDPTLLETHQANIKVANRTLKQAMEQWNPQATDPESAPSEGSPSGLILD